MSKIEDIIQKNKDKFDEYELGIKHFEDFQKKLSKFNTHQNKYKFLNTKLVLKIAAVIIIMVSLSVVYFNSSINDIKNFFSEKLASTELPVELQEVMKYYNILTDKKVNEIDQLAVSDDEAQKIKEMVMIELKELDDNITELAKEYSLNSNNDRIIAALINNQRMQVEVLNKILHQLNQTN